MFRIGSIKPAGERWWHVTIKAPWPDNANVPMKQYSADDGEREIWERAQAWCDDRNIELGFVQPCKRPRFQPTAKYRRRATIVFKG